MAKRKSRADLETALHDSEADRHVLERVVLDTYGGRGVGRDREGVWRVRYGSLGAACGGWVVLVQRGEGGGSVVQARWLDDAQIYARRWLESGSYFAEALALVTVLDRVAARREEVLCDR